MTQAIEVEERRCLLAALTTAPHRPATTHARYGKRSWEHRVIDACNLAQGGAAATPRARRYKSYYVEHASAEMSTVLRKQAPILIRLREKMGLHLCTVFHSTLYAIIQTRNAPKLRLMQNRTRILCNDTCTRQAEFMHKTEIRNSAHVA